MVMKDRPAKYVYPAIFEPGEVKGYCVTFPDLPGCITEGNTIEEALTMAKEALSLHLWGMEDDDDPIPQPTLHSCIKTPEGGFISLVEVWMVPIRDKMANKAVNKMLTLPKWLNDLAEEEQVNFSRCRECQQTPPPTPVRGLSGFPKPRPLSQKPLWLVSLTLEGQDGKMYPAEVLPHR